MNIYIDYRETDLYDYLSNKQIGTNTNDFKINKINLEIGDIQIEPDDKSFKLVFERKTISDLLSSIKDGRYKEQKTRMMSAFDTSKCCYIIENQLCSSNRLSEQDKYILDSAIIHTMFRDKIHVIETDNVQQTGNWIIKIATRCQKNPQNFSNDESENQNVKYIDCLKVKTKKSDNIDKNTCYLLQLCQIPGISKTIAKEIIKVYPTLKELYNSDVSIEKLKEIPMIGGIKAKLIHQYIN